MQKITADMLATQIRETLDSKKSEAEKTSILMANGVATERDEPPLWHREGDSAWAIYLEDGQLHVQRAKACDVDPSLFA